MKILILILLACLALTACTQTAKKDKQNGQTEMCCTVSQGEALLNILNANGQSLIVLNNDSLSYHNARGVQDLIQLTSDEPERLKGASVADKVVGRAAAALMIAAGVSEVHTNLISTPALQMLQEAGVRVYATEEVPQILNRDRSDQCPIEATLNDADNVEECVAILKARFQN